MSVERAFETDSILLRDRTGLVTFDVDPTTTGFNAPIGSLGMRTDGVHYRKTGALDTDWTQTDTGIPVAEKGAANGVATLDVGGKVPVSQIPATALPEVHVVADEAARLALVVQEGDEAIQIDDGSHWIYDGTTWYERPQPATFPLEIQDDGVSQTLAATRLNFVGFTITEPVPDQITIESPAGGGQKALAISLDHGTTTNNAAYEVLCTLVWPGSDQVGVPVSIKANAFAEGGGDVGDWRVYDVTNALTIGEVIGIVSTDVANIVDLGSISNVTTGEALWEIQGRETNGGKGANFDFYSMTINL